MINVNRRGVAREVIGILLVGVGISVLVGVLLYHAPYILWWLSSYPAWVTFLVGFVVFSLGAFLAVREHIKATKKAHKTESDSHQERSRT